MSTQTLDLTELALPKVVYRLYNPAPYEQCQDYGAKTWRLPAKGVLEIHDILVRGNDKAPPQILPAKDIRIALVGEDGRSGKLGSMGVRPLLGDARDEAIKAEADAAFAENQYQVMLGVKLAHMSRVAKERENGVAPSPPDKRVREAMEFVAKIERERGLTGALTCQDCGWALQSEKDMEAHVANIHPEKALAGKQFGAQVAPVTSWGTPPAPPTVNAEARVAQVVAARPQRPQPRGK